MKKIGLNGGTGPESTLVYYKEINTICNKKCGGAAFPEMSVESLNLFKALELVQNNKLDELADYIAGKIDNLVRGGAEIVALTAATMHVVYGKLKPKVSVPFISIPETVAEEAALAKINASNLTYGGTVMVESGSDKGIVVSQSVDAFTDVEEHTKIVITVSSGPME